MQGRVTLNTNKQEHDFLLQTKEIMGYFHIFFCGGK